MDMYVLAFLCLCVMYAHASVWYVLGVVHLETMMLHL